MQLLVTGFLVSHGLCYPLSVFPHGFFLLAKKKNHLSFCSTVDPMRAMLIGLHILSIHEHYQGEKRKEKAL